jgi:nucleolar MIF4G domain-containing protein 1
VDIRFLNGFVFVELLGDIEFGSNGMSVEEDHQVKAFKGSDSGEEDMGSGMDSEMELEMGSELEMESQDEDDGSDMASEQDSEEDTGNPDEDALSEKESVDNQVQPMDTAQAIKYIPPHLRLQPTTKSEKYIKLKRMLQGLLNRLSDANMETVMSGIEERLLHEARHGNSYCLLRKISW